VSTPPALYRLLVHGAVPLVPALLRDPRQQHADAARRAAPARLAEWARQDRDPSRPLVWFHAPSVGEGLQARAVFEALRARRPDIQLVYTHFSPSAEAFAASLTVDFASYLPYDRAADMTTALNALHPALLVFTKLDLWPELATQAAARGVPVAMVAATVTADSGRLRWPARFATRTGYAALTAVAAVSRGDADRLQELGVAPTRIRITGDPRADSVCAVVAEVAPDDPLTMLAMPSDTLVAGSTWPDDEAVLLEAFATVRAAEPRARLIVVPHEPTPAHLEALHAMARRHDLPAPVLLSQLVPGDPPALVVADRVGVLARLYANGAMAYVGGGFGSAGIHSVLEPAAWGRPVVIGGRDRGSRDAALLRDAGGLITLPATAAAQRLAARWLEWLRDPERAKAEGERNRAALEEERGASDRSAAMLEALLR
jgi:3-deoxy-D-manno-octulosonic-acid transferase